MLLMQLARIDLRGIFEQGFRLIVLMILLINYILLFFMHFFMVRPLHTLCGHQYFSVFSRWLFITNRPSNISSGYWEIRTSCYISNILDVTIIGFAFMFIVSAIVEACLSHSANSKLEGLHQSPSSSSSPEQEQDQEQAAALPAGVAGSYALLRQRLTRKVAFRRLILRVTISLITAVFATTNFISIFTVFLLFNLIETTLSDTLQHAYRSSLFALKWQIIMYMFFSFFFCGLLWSVQGIYKSQLETILARSRRLDQFKRMNASVTESTIV